MNACRPQPKVRPSQSDLPDPYPNQVAERESANVLILAVHQILFRLGWLFKTETVVVPTLVDYIAGPAWVRGWLPTFSRLGQSLPPLLFSDRWGQCGRFKWHLAASTGLMAVLFAGAAWMWRLTGPAKPWWVCPAVLAVYFGFFVANGFYQVLFGSLQGKLIRPERRGQLLQLSTFVGTIPSVILGWFLLRRWFADPANGFGYIFVAAAIGFGSSALVVLAVWEPRRDRSRDKPRGEHAYHWWTAIRQDKDLRQLLAICFFVSANWMLTPHYQAFGRARFEATAGHLTVWVIAQSVAVGIFSLAVGPLADWKGNRLAMRILIFGSAISPLAALGITSLPAHISGQWYWLVYLPLGLAPLVNRVIFNYALELCEPQLHPAYQSIVNLGLALPLAFSPIFGWLIDATSFEVVFSLAALSVLGAGMLTFGLAEPRYRLPEPMAAHPSAESPE
ncbi:MAG: hypothetical protein NZ899_01975 [Thermoguttaceae bacterium]|nr:hypothetical protein [Thermoguttaceae bacterium]MDW8078703.1 hypothetical protein [Thermoguttaceae bacterium]